MTAEKHGLVTELIGEIAAGDSKAKERLFEAVYRELHKIARDMMVRERPDHTLQATALVNEAYLRLAGGEILTNPRNRRYFFGAAAKAMRQVLRDYVDMHQAKKRGGDWKRVPLEDVLFGLKNLEVENNVALDEALTRLAAMDRRAYDIVELRFFGGMRHDEIAKELGVSVSTVEKEWRYARAWLRHELKRSGTTR